MNFINLSIQDKLFTKKHLYNNLIITLITYKPQVHENMMSNNSQFLCCLKQQHLLQVEFVIA